MSIPTNTKFSKDKNATFNTDNKEKDILSNATIKTIIRFKIYLYIIQSFELYIQPI